jgi:pimeloyl-ACP methyl ester carboxylesterase
MTSVFDEDSDGLSPIGKGIAIGVGALAASAIASAYLSSKAETDNPPVGNFVDVDGVKVHYLELGEGEPIVFFHGKGAMLQDFASSGLLDLAAKSHRVIAFDRPGFGYSERPSDRVWTPAAQAKLFQDVFAKLQIGKPIVVGHSWGTLVALRLAIDHPQDVARLVLLSGYYYPSARADTILSVPGAMPVLGNIIQHTIGPIIGRLAADSTIEKLFKPLQVPTEFTAAYSKEMALRPSQLKAVAEESAMMPAAIAEIGNDYKLLDVPITMFAGSLDDIVDTDTQSLRFHGALPASKLHIEQGVGHMIHHAIPKTIAAAF